MNKYLLITNDGAYVFEAKEGDVFSIIASSLEEHPYIEIQTLGRINGGLQVENIDIPENALNRNAAELSYGETGWERLYVGNGMVKQLQPFSEEARRERLKEEKAS